MVYNMRAKLSDLFFPIDLQPLMVNNQRVPNYYAICDRDRGIFLGVKKNNQNNMPNQEAYYRTLEVYERLSGSQGTAYNWWMNEYYNQSEVIVSGLQMDKFVETFKTKIIDSIREIAQNQSNSLQDRNLSDFLDSNVSQANHKFDAFTKAKLASLDLSVAFVNGYDLDCPCNFYLILRWIDNDFRIKYLAIARQSIFDDIGQIVNKFLEELISFINISYKRYLTPINKKYIRPLLFNIYNKNIEPITVQNDDAYRIKLMQFDYSVQNFINSLGFTDLNYYAFTEYIIHNCFLFEDTVGKLKISNRDSIISVNKVYQDTISRLAKFYYNPNARNDYESGNLGRLEAIEKWLC